jgi:alpha-beta hydrolase superfamily lysophospholipase
MPELQGADKTLLVFPGMRHALSIDLGREKVFEDILAWAGPRV